MLFGVRSNICRIPAGEGSGEERLFPKEERGKKVKGKPKILYAKYIERQYEEEEAARIKKELQETLPDEGTAIVVRKEAPAVGLLKIISEILRRFLKFLCYAAFVALASVGATTLINESTRSAFFLLF